MLPREIAAEVFDGIYTVKKDYVIKNLTVESLTDVFGDETSTPDNKPVVDMMILEKFFDKKAFTLFLKLVEEKKRKADNVCKTCKSKRKDEWVMCDGCRNWSHFKCVNFKLENFFYCPECRKNYVH